MKLIKPYMLWIRMPLVRQIFYHYSKKQLYNIHKANNPKNNFQSLTIVINYKKYNKKEFF